MESAVTWVIVTGIHDIGQLEALGRCFDLHPLKMDSGRVNLDSLQ